MSKFLAAFRTFLAIAVVLFLAAAVCYFLAYDNPRSTDARVSKIAEELDGLYARNASPAEKREAIVSELVHENEMSFGRIIWEHLAEALFLAAIMIVAVEGFTSYLATKEAAEHNDALEREFTAQNDKLTGKFEEQNNRLVGQFETQATGFEEKITQISNNVWRAIFQRLIPAQIATEVERILKSDVCRIRPQYTIILSRQGYTGIPANHIVVKRQLYYRLMNITPGDTPDSVEIQTTNTTVGEITLTGKGGNSVVLPRICEVVINGVDYAIGPEKRTHFSQAITLPKMTSEADAWGVRSEVEGVSLETDRVLYSLSAPCYGLEVHVINQLPELLQVSNVYLTSNTPLRPTTKDKWSCDAGLLPGTALSVSWRLIEDGIGN
jgi:hypothetical protein